MKYIHKCENCIWFDRCHEDEACENYEPMSLGEQETIDIEEYEEDLRMRHEFYRQQIDEQDE